MRYVFYYLLPMFIGVIGGVMLSNLVSEVDIDTEPFLLPFFIVFITAYVLFLVYWYGIRREKYEYIQIDERVEAVINKSARNAFIVTWLAMFIFVDFGAPDADSLLIVVASGLVVLIVSYYVYLFKSG